MRNGLLRYNYHTQTDADGSTVLVWLTNADNRPIGIKKKLASPKPALAEVVRTHGYAPVMLHDGYLKAIDDVTAELLTLEQFAESKLDGLRASHKAV